jgi:hypothetical protein
MFNHQAWQNPLADSRKRNRISQRMAIITFVSNFYICWISSQVIQTKFLNLGMIRAGV